MDAALYCTCDIVLQRLTKQFNREDVPQSVALPACQLLRLRPQLPAAEDLITPRSATINPQLTSHPVTYLLTQKSPEGNRIKHP